MATESSLIITYGGGEALYYVFNAIATLFKSEVFRNILYIASVLIGFWNIIIAISKQNSVFLFKWFGWFILITQILLLPTVTVLIEDPLTKFKRTVDNVPHLLGSFGSVVSRVGDALTKETESLFTLPDYLPYHQTGNVFASKLFRQMNQFKVRDATLKGNLSRFIQNCVVYDAMVGFKYTINDLQTTDNILDLISNTSHIIGFSYQTNTKVTEDKNDKNKKSGSSTEILSCAAGIAKIKADLGGEVNSVAGIMGNKLGLTTDPKDKINQTVSKALLSKLSSSYQFMTGISKTGEEILKQEMLINAIGDATKNKVEELGNPQTYAATKALLQQRSTYNIVGNLAAQTLSTMKVVFEVICYAAFIFIPIMVLLPGGLQIISNYFGMLAWIQLWAPLYAVLNLLISIGAKAKSAGIIGSGGLTMLTSVGYSNLHCDIESIAGYLSMSIPFISYAIVKGGVGSLMNLAGSLSSGYQAASASVASELVSGNLSMGNVSYATSSMYNKSGFKHDTNFSHHAGRMEMGSEDGSVVFRTPTGSVGFKAGSGMTTSSWDQQLNLQSNLSSSLSKSLQNEHSHMAALSTEYSRAESKTFREASNFMQRLSKSGAHNQSFSTGTSAEDAKSITNTKNFMEELQNRYGYSSQAAADVAAALSIGGGIGKTSANMSTSFKSSSDFQDAINKGKQIAESKGYSDSFSKVIRNSDQIAFSENEQIEKGLAQDLAKSYDQMQGIRHAMSVSEQNIERLSKARSYMETHGANLNQDLSQKFVEYVAAQKVNTGNNFDQAPSEIGYSTARKIIMTKGADYHAYLQGFMEKELNNIANTAPSMSGGAKFDNLEQVNPEPIQQATARYKANMDQGNRESDTRLNNYVGAGTNNAKTKEPVSALHSQHIAGQKHMSSEALNQSDQHKLYEGNFNRLKQPIGKENLSTIEAKVEASKNLFQTKEIMQRRVVNEKENQLIDNFMEKASSPKLNKSIKNAPKALFTHDDGVKELEKKKSKNQLLIEETVDN